jgi:hypothetical protein
MESTPKNRKPLLIILSCIALMLTVINIGLSAIYSDAGQTMSRLSKDSIALQKEIDTLKRSSVQLVALTDLKTQAEALGYVRYEYVTEIRLDKPLAMVSR